MKILRLIKEEIVPLSGRQQITLLVIIACIFQFVLFYAPALADEAVKQSLAQTSAQSDFISNDSIIKESTINKEAAALIGPAISTITEKVVINPDTKLKKETSTTNIASSSANTTLPTTANTTSSSKQTIEVIRTSTHIITAYNSEVGQTDNTPCTTANGFDVCKHNQEDTIAANFLEFGTKVMIPELFGDRIFTVRDRMNKRNDNRVDIWMKTRTNALNFGKKVAKIQVVKVSNKQVTKANDKQIAKVNN